MKSQQRRLKKRVVEKRMGGKQVSNAMSTDDKQEFKRCTNGSLEMSDANGVRGEEREEEEKEEEENRERR
jgi:hypothetical protein